MGQPKNIASSKMKCFLVFATLACAAQAVPQFYIADTPEVQAAKAQFAAAWNAAASRNAVPVAPIHHVPAPVAPYAVAAPVAAPVPVAVAADFEDGESYPAAEPYIHYATGDVAIPYVHVEGPSAPAAPAAPVIATPTFNTVPVAAPAPVAGGCYNYKGEGVPCRY